jgi:N-acetylglucosamine-6-phosphate deacetylase
MLLVGRRYDTTETVTVRLADGKIEAIEPAGAETAGEELPWLSPGLVDLQVNGYGGQEFNHAALRVEDVAQISTALDRHGVTGYCPTATTHSRAMLLHSLATIARACDESEVVARRVIGIHLEGPYISPEDGPRGAHPRQHVRPPDWEEFQRFQEAAAGRLRILTLSPEYDGAAEFISRVVQSGVLVAIGHTSADSEQIKAAVDAGARLSTHLGNGAHGQLRRHPNYIWDQLAEDRLTASLIVDGHHLPPSVVKTFVRAKSPERCILVSDITGMAGMPAGVYENSSLGAVEVLEDGRLVIPGQRQLLAGAALPLTVGIANILRFTDESLRSATDMASSRPLALLGQAPVQLEVGQPANLTLFQLPAAARNGPLGDLTILATINRGELVYGDLPP